MTRRRRSMRQIREVLRLKFERELSNRQISVICKIGKTTIRDYISRFKESGMEYPIPETISHEDLENRLFCQRSAQKNKGIELDYKAILEELKRPNVTLALLRQEYKQANPTGFGYSWFCDFGSGLKYFDYQNQGFQETHLFVFCWGTSHYTYMRYARRNAFKLDQG